MNAHGGADAKMLLFAPAGTLKAPPRLVLHFDINETIMLGDPAGGDSYEDTLHKVIAKVAYVRPNPAAGTAEGRWTEYVWHDGSPLDPLCREVGAPPPPLFFDWNLPEGVTAFYKVHALKQFAKCFATPGSPGEIYTAELERLRDALRWPEGTPPDPRLSADGYYTFLPAFFHTLSELAAGDRDFSIVLRTFGTDLPHVAAAVSAFADGEHPLWKGQKFPSLRLRARDLWSGRYGAETGAFTLRRPHTDERRDERVSSARAAALAALAAADEDGTPVEPRTLATDLEVAAELSGARHDADLTGARHDAELSGAPVPSDRSAVSGVPRAPRGSICGVTDHYDWWREREYAPSAGKPFFWTLDDVTTVTLFFDDNIHNDPNESIVAVRARRDASSPYRPLSGDATRRLHGLMLRKVPTIKPILERGWFLEQLAASEAKLAAMRSAEVDGGEQDGGLLAEVRAMLPRA